MTNIYDNEHHLDSGHCWLPVQSQTITQTNVDFLSIRSLGTNLSEVQFIIKSISQKLKAFHKNVFENVIPKMPDIFSVSMCW